MTVLRNPAAAAYRSVAIPDREPLRLHRLLPGCAPTPLLDVSRLAERLELPVGTILVKDESSRLELPSFKLLGASWAIHRALNAQPSPRQSVVLAAASDGNYGTAVARMARLVGCAADIFVPVGTSSARIASIEAEGARVEVVESTFDDAVARSEEMANDAKRNCVVVSDTSSISCRELPNWVIQGYSTIFWEIDDALTERSWSQPDIVFVPMGVGALAGAAVRHYSQKPEGERPVIVGVEPTRAACVQESIRAGEIVRVPAPTSIMAGLNCGTPSTAAWPDLAGGLDAMVSISDERAIDAVRALAEIGVATAETGAAALGGLVEFAAADASLLHVEGRQPRVLLLQTEGVTDKGAYENYVGRSMRATSAAQPHDSV
jgi:diaminopropionate ammonia-lyase